MKMETNERKLFQELCKISGLFEDDSIFETVTPELLGYLFFNRMHGIAYHQLKANLALHKVPREFRNSLKAAYDQNILLNQDYKECVKYVASLLKDSNCMYAMLKGAFLCFYYPEGCRISNDIDLLVPPNDVSKIGGILAENGFIQGKIENDVFVPATRREIIESKMLRGETVPYIKEVNLPSRKYLEVDINYSLDYKNSDSRLVEEMIARTKPVDLDDHTMKVLSEEDFLIHLCVHLYKEATTYPWVVMQRDMVLYKYEDIRYMLSRMSYGDITKVFKRAEELKLDKECAYAFLQTSELLGLDVYIVLWSLMALGNDNDILHIVVSPSDKITYRYINEDIQDRFFHNQRKKLLREVKNNATVIDEKT